MASYATLPPGADTSAIKPFKVAIPEETLQDMKTLIKLSKVAVPSYENTHSGEDADHHYGIDREWVVKAKGVWEGEYDWLVDLLSDAAFRGIWTVRFLLSDVLCNFDDRKTCLRVCSGISLFSACLITVNFPDCLLFIPLKFPF